MAKSKVVARPQVRQRRRQSATEHTITLLAVGGVIAVVVGAVALIGFGWYQTHIKPLGKNVLQVGTVNYDLGALERRMKVMKSGSSFYTQNQSAAAQLPDDAMSQLEVEAKVLQGASLLHVSVSQDELATDIKTKGGVSKDAKADVYAASLRSQVNASGLTENEFTMKTKAELLQKKLFDYFKFVARPIEPQVKADYLVADTQDKAQQAATRIKAGQDFKTVATDVVGNANGSLPWTPRGGSAFLPASVDTYLFDTAQKGQVSDPLSASGLFYVVRLLDRDQNHPLDDQGRQRAAQRDVTKWLDGLKITTTKHLTDSDKSRAIGDVL